MVPSMPENAIAETLPARSNGKHPGGRPTKRTPATIARIAEAIANGLPDEYVCALVGIRRETLWSWRNDPEFEEFSNAIKKAEATRLEIRLQRVEAGEAGWQGTAWFLERRYPREFSRPELQVAMNVEHTGTVEHQVTLVAETDLRRMSEIRCEIEAEVMAA